MTPNTNTVEIAGVDIAETTPAPERAVMELVEVCKHEGYDANAVAKYFINMSGEHFLSLRDTGEVFMYKDGVYVPGAEQYITENAVAMMDGRGTTTHALSETVNLVRQRTMIDRLELDAHPEMVNMRNGLYNRITGELKPHTPEHLSVQQLHIKYDAGATAPLTQKFISEIVATDDTRFVYEMFWYAMEHSKKYRTAIFLVGKGMNGKSVLMKLLTGFIGDDNTAHITPNEMGDGDKYARADLFGCMLNVVDDLGDDVITGTGPFKSVITNELIRAQRKYGQPFAFVPHVLCVFGCNALPETTDSSDGFMSRMRVLSFDNKFEGAGADINILDKLTSGDELSGLFNLAMAAGAEVVERGGFSGAMSTAEKRHVYLCTSNNFFAFVDEVVTFVDTAKEEPHHTPKDIVYDAYVKWCGLRGYNNDVASDRSVTKMLKKMGHPSIRTGNGYEKAYCYKNVDIGRKAVQQQQQL